MGTDKDAASLLITQRVRHGWRVVPSARMACSRDRKRRSARAVQHERPRQHRLRSPASCALLYHGVVCLGLTPPLPSAAVGLSVGQDERLLRDGIRAIRAYAAPRLTTACTQRTGRSYKQALSLDSAKEPGMTDEELREVTRKTADMLFGPPKPGEGAYQL